MYTKAGNRRLTKVAQKAYDAIDKLVKKDEATRASVRKVLVVFIMDWEALSNKKGTEEASDTAVREVVAGFHDQLWGSVFGFPVDYAVWNENRDEAYHQLIKKT